MHSEAHDVHEGPPHLVSLLHGDLPVARVEAGATWQVDLVAEAAGLDLATGPAVLEGRQDGPNLAAFR